MKIVSFLIAFVIFSIVILFHELGHFLLAKANGIRVNEFCFGLGPTICGIQKGETKYCIKAFPFGGACMMEGEDEDSTDNRAFGKKPVWGRMSVVFAGPFFNFILAFIFAFILMSCVGYDKPVLSGVMEGYAAEEAGLQEGDEIIRMNHFRFISAEKSLHTEHFIPGKPLKSLMQGMGRNIRQHWFRNWIKRPEDICTDFRPWEMSG